MMKDLVARTAAEAAGSIAEEAKVAAEQVRSEFTGAALRRRVQEALANELGVSLVFKEQMTKQINSILGEWETRQQMMVIEAVQGFEDRIGEKMNELQELLELIGGDARASREDANLAIGAVREMRDGLASLGSRNLGAKAKT